MKLKILAGTTSRIMRVFLQDASVTTGAGLAGLVFNSAGLTCYQSRVGAAGAAAVSLVTAAVGTWTSGGFVAVDGANMPGVYELHLPDALLASGSTAVHLLIKGAANLMPVAVEIELDAVNYQSSTAFVASVPAVTGAVGSVTGGVGGTLGDARMANLDAAVSSRLATAGYTAPPSAVANAQAVWQDATGGDFTVAGSPGRLLMTQLGNAFTGTGSVFTSGALVNAPTGGSAPTPTQNAAAVRVELAVELARIDTAVGTRSVFAGGAVASVTAPVTVGTNNDKTGYALSGAGLDAVQVETGVNARQAMSPILAAAAGVLIGSGPGAGTITIKGGNVAVTRISATTDGNGNRTAVNLTLPA